MFVVGRSGSGLVHAFLDGHPQILHVPHTFKFYDFVGQNPGLLAAGPSAVINTFLDSPLVPFLFDSSHSVIIGGRLGANMASYVRVDRDWMRQAFLSAIGDRSLTWRLVFLGIVLAYGLAIGQDPAATRVVFHHVHHGDWLWPDRLVERSNYHSPLPMTPREILQADRYVLSVREPRDAAMAYWRFIEGQALPDPARLNAHDQFHRLLLQDWDRLKLAATGEVPAHVVRLEDLRADARAAMSRLAAFLGIESAHPSLTRLTYYGLEWYGDIYTPPSPTIHTARPPVALPWQDRWAIEVTLGALAARFGYAKPRLVELKRALLGLTTLLPSRSLRDRSIDGAAAAWRAASARATARLQFTRLMWRRLA
jgi:hypothetical protein